MVRKIHLAKLLNEGKIDAVVTNLNMTSEKEALEYLAGFGVSQDSVEIWGRGVCQEKSFILGRYD